MSADDDRADQHRPTRRWRPPATADAPATWTGSVRWADAANPAAWMPGGAERFADAEDTPTRAMPMSAPSETPEHSGSSDSSGPSEDAGSSESSVQDAVAGSSPDAAEDAPRVASLPLIADPMDDSDSATEAERTDHSEDADRPVQDRYAPIAGARTVGAETAAGADADEALAAAGPQDFGDDIDLDALDSAEDQDDQDDPDDAGPGARRSEDPGSFSRRLADDPRTGAMPTIDLEEASQREAAATENTIYELRTAAQHLEEVLIGGKRVLTRKEVAQLAEVSTLSARKLWRSLGQPRISEGEAAFTVSDAAPLRRLADLVSSELVDEETALQLSRAIGQMTDRLVVWQMEAMVEFLIEEKGLSDSEARLTALDVFEDLIDPLQDLMVYAWRRNLAGALGRLNVNVEEGLEIGGTSRGQDTTMPLARAIGFIDLVSYTRLSQQLDSRELSRLVKKFQFLAYNIVAAGGGKVIKTVGDEVFFAAETPLAGAEIAMTLLEQVKVDESLPRCRVGFSWGRVLSRMGDIFGTTVNLAARLTAVADPDTVVTDADTARIIERDDAFEFAGRRDLNLQGLGEVGVVEMHRLSASTINTEDIV